MVAAYQFQLLPDLTVDEYERLKADIAVNGVLVPVELDERGDVLDGHHRIRAWTELREAGLDLPKYAQIKRAFDDDDERIEHALKLNLQRRHLNREQLRQLALDLRGRGWTLDRVGATVGVHLDTVRRWCPDLTFENTKVEGKDGKARPTTYKPRKPSPMTLGDGLITQEQQHRQEKEAKREEQREANRVLVDASPSLSVHVAGQVYETIVIDPPWDWGDEGDGDQFGRGRPTYDTMPISEITALPIADLASANSHIYLWITNRSLPKGFALLDAWGFRYVTMLTWTKPSIGMGNYYRGSTEHILFGVRGSLPLLRRDVGTWFAAPRADLHSAKPDAFYQLVESCSPGPWLELFARRERPGWVHWGAES